MNTDEFKLLRPIVNEIGNYVYAYLYIYIWAVCVYCVSMFVLIFSLFIIGIQILTHSTINRAETFDN